MALAPPAQQKICIFFIFCCNNLTRIITFSRRVFIPSISKNPFIVNRDETTMFQLIFFIFFRARLRRAPKKNEKKITKVIFFIYYCAKNLSIDSIIIGAEAGIFTEVPSLI